MKVLLIILQLALYIQVLSQKTDSVGYLSNLKGKGFCVRQGAQTNLKIPFFFYTGDKVNMVSGNAVIVLKSEEEVKLGTGESFTVVAQNSSQKKQNDLLMYRNTKQSTSSFKMRSLGEPAFLIFPNRSKLANTENAILLIKSKMKSKYFFKLADVESKNFIYKLSEVSDTLISLKNCDLLEGKAYTWTIRYPEFTISGDLEVITDEQKKSLPHFDFSNRASYTKAFNYYCDEDFFFDAYSVIEDAIKAYPEDGYFQYLKKSLFGQ